ncbi:hypothetical protein DFS33DRAFT_692473 [Desarmillaria ectypa]|nr:hypothetical protein DFS33DRAFT_692473 [Desarmillaria ectypa]
MATTARQPKSLRKGAEPVRAWTGARASPTFSASPAPSRPSNAQQPASPPSGQANGARPEDSILRSLSGLTGTTITLTTKTSIHYEGVISSTSGEGDTTGVTLKDVKEISNPGTPLKDQVFIASTNIERWASGPANAKLTNGETFRTDIDISQKKLSSRERELQAWQPSSDTPVPAQYAQGDEATFGPGANSTSWDQFAVNKTLFGVTASFDEDAYTTKLDRSTADYKERERKAQRIADEITGATASNPHIAEERNQTVDDSGVNEEDKYGAVVRGTNVYVPPGARKPGAVPPVSNAARNDVPKVSVNGPDGAAVASQSQSPPSSSKASSPAPSSGSTKPPADAVPAFRDFVTNEKQRLTQKRQALVKSEMEKRVAELVKFSQNFKLNKPIPDDLVPILAKDEDKQRAIKEKASKDAASAQARNIGSNVPSGAPRANPAKLADAARKPSATSTAVKTPAPPVAAASAATQKPAASTTKPAESTVKKPIPMVIQAIPPFKGPKSRPVQSASVAKNANGAAAPPTPLQDSAHTAPLKPPQSPSARLNANASSFRPNPKASAFTPGTPSPASSSASPKPKDVATPNPFFGTRPIKKSPPVNIKDDFNPFKHNKVVDASAITAMWPYNGKRYLSMYPQPQHQPPQHSPHMVAPPPPMPPPSYEEDSAAQAAARGGYIFYPPYGYPGQPPMMAGMAPPGPPGAYMPGPFMPPMPYPPAMYAPPGMGQMPPQAYMPPPPPPGGYPSANGAGPRQSMPPTPIPQHAHTYYHQSPQLQHAVPYGMMMPPPTVPPHGYEGGPAPVPMGGHA